MNAPLVYAQAVFRYLKAAFPATIPVLSGYWFLGLAFGVLLTTSGFSPWWAPFAAIVVYAGSGQLVAIGLLLADFDPVGMFLTVLLVNARHLFYGLSTIERFRGWGPWRAYLVYSLTDETFAVFNSARVPDGLDEKRYLTAIAGMDQFYWLVATSAGAFAGEFIHFDVTGIDFVMTALFFVICLQQIESKPNRAPALIGFGASVLALVVLGPDMFLLPAMAVILGLLLAGRSKLEGMEVAGV
ncbi:MAG: AzlC family ABC transporter permease [Propionibacteriaceae bacterium]|nr:AzlC family ABC transporter permease [Propionibacteriaceae bacterium]